MKKEEIREIINDFCNEKGLSKSAFAKMCGVSDGTLSFIENGQWEKVSDEMAQKIKSFIDRKTGGDIYQSTDFVSIFKACDAARKFHLMIGVLADTGVGKPRQYALMPDRRTFSMCRSASLSRRTSSFPTCCANWVCRLRVR